MPQPNAIDENIHTIILRTYWYMCVVRQGQRSYGYSLREYHRQLSSDTTHPQRFRKTIGVRIPSIAIPKGEKSQGAHSTITVDIIHFEATRLHYRRMIETHIPLFPLVAFDAWCKTPHQYSETKRQFFSKYNDL